MEEDSPWRFSTLGVLALTTALAVALAVRKFLHPKADVGFVIVGTMIFSVLGTLGLVVIRLMRRS